jgi:uncharacterized protein YjbI with pentapeptide repeats
VGAFTTPKGAVLPANLKQADVSGLSFYGKELSAMALQGACLNNTRLSNALWHGVKLESFLQRWTQLFDHEKTSYLKPLANKLKNAYYQDTRPILVRDKRLNNMILKVLDINKKALLT